METMLIMGGGTAAAVLLVGIGAMIADDRIKKREEAAKLAA